MSTAAERATKAELRALIRAVKRETRWLKSSIDGRDADSILRPWMLYGAIDRLEAALGIAERHGLKLKAKARPAQSVRQRKA